MQDNLGGDFKEFQSAYEAVGTDLYDQQEESLRKLTQTATKYVLQLDGWIQKNKGLAQTIGLIAGGALGLIAVIGGIGLIAWPVIAGINAIIAGGWPAWCGLYDNQWRGCRRNRCYYVAGRGRCGGGCRWRAADSKILGAGQRLFRRCYRGADECLCAGRGNVRAADTRL